MPGPRRSDAIILLGLDKDAPREAQALRRLGNHVIPVWGTSKR
jgi:hypothetical protein